MFFLFLFILMILFLVFEKILHDRRLASIPIRIHVNGIRGKTAITASVAAAFRTAGIRTVAKTTGDSPVLIYPDGCEEIIPRKGLARIQEQIRFIKKAARMDAEAVVVECMALDPHLQFVSESKMLKATIGIITNVRPDHMEVMGESLNEIAVSLGSTIPHDGFLVTGDREYFDYFQKLASTRNTIACLAEHIQDADTDQNKIRPGLSSFAGNNLAIVQKVCSFANVDFDIGKNYGNYLNFDKRFPKVLILKTGSATCYFVDLFSANDVYSTEILQHAIVSSQDLPKPFVALFNNRADRPLRMLSFVDFLAANAIYDFIVFAGENTFLARNHLYRKGRKDKLFVSGCRKPADLLHVISMRIGQPRFTVFGMGNFKGLGKDLNAYVQSRGRI